MEKVSIICERRGGEIARRDDLCHYLEARSETNAVSAVSVLRSQLFYPFFSHPDISASLHYLRGTSIMNEAHQHAGERERERFRIRGCEIDTRGFLRETRRKKSFWKCENADCGCTESCPSYFSFFLTFISICKRRETLQKKRKDLLVTMRRSKFSILEIIIRSELFLENNRKTLASEVFVYGRVYSRIVCL